MYTQVNKSWIKNIEFMFVDFLCLQLAFTLAYMYRFGFNEGVPYADPQYLRLGLLFGLVGIVVTFFWESYNSILKRGYLVEARETVKYCAAALLLTIICVFVIKQGETYSRVVFFATGIFAVIILYCGRFLLKKCFAGTLKGYSNIFLATNSSLAQQTLQSLQKGNDRSFRVAGVIALDNLPVGEVIAGVPVVATRENALIYVKNNAVDEVFVDIVKHDAPLQAFVEGLHNMGVTVHQGVIKRNLTNPNQIIQTVGPYTVITSSVKIASVKQMFIKRVVDIVGGLVGLPVIALACIIVAPFLLIQSPGPIFFSQTRVGRNGRTFQLYKFRSMYMDAEERKKELMAQNTIKGGLMFKMDNDPRIIKGIGNFIRKTSIDELPQLWNVLKGEMSLVGTRPPTVDEVEKYEIGHRIRLATKPGITGMWQVSGRSTIVDFKQVVALDLEYIQDWSLRLDIKILLKTVLVVLKKDGSK